MEKYRRLGESLVDVAFPKRCAGCDRRGSWLCDACRATILPIGDRGCIRCGVPRVAGSCACSDLHPAIERAVSPYPYAGWVAEAIRHLKYANETARADQLGRELIEPIRSLGPVDGLIPVPLHPRKLRERGYNQSELLARSVSEALDVPMLSMIQRTRHTTAQMTLDAEARRKNVAHAFAYLGESPPKPDARYVVIDDVRTTGSTLWACAEALVAAGIERVLVATLAVDLTAERLDALRRMGLIRDQSQNRLWLGVGGE
ncbi:MAG: ComF family protein [Thermomicrobiales bacterium]